MFKRIHKAAARKQWDANKADPTTAISYTWEVGRHTIVITAIWEVELKVNGRRVSYGTDTPVGRLVEKVYQALEAIQYAKYYDDDDVITGWR